MKQNSFSFPQVFSFEEIQPTLMAAVMTVFEQANHKSEYTDVLKISEALLKQFQLSITACQNQGLNEKEICGWVSTVLTMLSKESSLLHYRPYLEEDIKKFTKSIKRLLESHEHYFTIYDATFKPLVEKSRLQKEISSVLVEGPEKNNFKI